MAPKSIDGQRFKNPHQWVWDYFALNLPNHQKALEVKHMISKDLARKLKNLVGLKGKQLGRKIEAQKRTIGNDRLRARIILVNTANRVIRRYKSRGNDETA